MSKAGKEVIFHHKLNINKQCNAGTENVTSFCSRQQGKEVISTMSLIVQKICQIPVEESESESCSVVSDSLQPHGLQSMEFSRPEYQSGQPFLSPVDLPNPGIEPRSPALQVDSLPAEPPGTPKNTGVGSLSLLQKIFPTQELNQDLLHCRWIHYQLSYKRSPKGFITNSLIQSLEVK